MAFTARLGTAESRLGNIQLGFGASTSLALSVSGGTATAAGGTVSMAGVPPLVLSASGGTATASGGLVGTGAPLVRLPTLAFLGGSTNAARIDAHHSVGRVDMYDNDVIVGPNIVDVLMPA